MRVLKGIFCGLLSLLLFLCLLYALAPRSALLLSWLERQGLCVVPSLVKEGLFHTTMEGVEITASPWVIHLDSLEIDKDVVARCDQGWMRISYVPLSGGTVFIKDLTGQCLHITGLGKIEGQLRFKVLQKGLFGQVKLFDVQTPMGIVDLMIDFKGRTFHFFSPGANLKGDGEISWDSKRGFSYRLLHLS